MSDRTTRLAVQAEFPEFYVDCPECPHLRDQPHFTSETCELCADTRKITIATQKQLDGEMKAGRGDRMAA
jgi:hypothetical protein